MSSHSPIEMLVFIFLDAIMEALINGQSSGLFSIARNRVGNNDRISQRNVVVLLLMVAESFLRKGASGD